MATTETYKGLRIETYETAGAPYAKLWRGKAAKPFSHYRFRDEAHRSQYIAEQRAAEDSRQSILARRAEEKRKVRETLDARALIQPGTVVVNTWGYDQTNVDYYVVESVSRCYVTLRRICAAGHVATGWAQERTHAHVCEPHGKPGDWRGRDHVTTSRHKVVQWEPGGSVYIRFEHGSGQISSPERMHWSSSYA